MSKIKEALNFEEEPIEGGFKYWPRPQDVKENIVKADKPASYIHYGTYGCRISENIKRMVK